MNVVRTLQTAALLTATIAFPMTFSGCHAAHPDDSAAVYQALQQHDLASVEVAQDRDKGVLTLTGLVGDQARKDRAQQLAQQTAPGYTIQNNIQVDSGGVLGMANPNAKAPDVEEMAHPQTSSNSNAPAQPK